MAAAAVVESPSDRREKQVLSFFSSFPLFWERYDIDIPVNCNDGKQVIPD